MYGSVYFDKPLSHDSIFDLLKIQKQSFKSVKFHKKNHERLRNSPTTVLSLVILQVPNLQLYKKGIRWGANFRSSRAEVFCEKLLLKIS